MTPLELPSGWEAWPQDRKLALRDRLRLARCQTTYRYRPAAFAHECIDWPEGERPAAYQLEVLEQLVAEHKIAIRGPHGLGKTGIAAWVIHWFALTRDLVDDWKAPTTASVWGQLQEFLWPEVDKWSRRLKWDVIGRVPYDTVHELQTMALRLETGSAFAVASKDASSIEGAHADQMLYVYDEAKTIQDDTFDATEGAFSGAGVEGREAYALALSTPGPPHGRFYAIHQRKAGLEDWHPVHVKLERAVEAGRISKAWAEQKRIQWGETSPLYQNRVLGEFADELTEAVIPLSWVEAAVERWKDLAVIRTDRTYVLPPEVLPPFTNVGVDVGDAGPDATVMALRFGYVIAEIRRPEGDTMDTTGRAKGVVNKYGGYVVLDVIGVGTGPTARLREQKVKVDAFNASSSSHRTDRTGELGFANRRAEAWWGMREALDPKGNPTICLPPDDLMIGDLTAPKWKTTSSGKLLVESKDDIRKRLKRSTDTGDAVVMSFNGRKREVKVASAKHRRLPSAR